MCHSMFCISWIKIHLFQYRGYDSELLVPEDDDTKWMNATGWSCYTCKGQTESDRLADCLYNAADQILKNQVIRTAKKTSTSSEKLHAQQYSVKTISWITNLILSICRAKLVNKQ